MNSQKLDPHNHATAWSKHYPRAFSNLMHMGHCAPTVMRTILDVSSSEKEWLVKLSAGMPGGIGNTGHECGGVTSPLVMLGTQFGLRTVDGGLPVIFDRGYALCQRFVSCHRTLQCKEIRGNDHFPRHCIPPVLRAPGMFMDAQNGIEREPIPAAARAGYARLYAHFMDHGFHCAREVFRQLGYQAHENPELFDAVSAFMGGTLFMGRTCSAFTAGVMSIGLRIGEIEDSPLRVFRLLAIMTADGNAFDDRLNKFNHSMNLGYKLSKWFARQFGSTQCQELTGCDFASPSGVDHYIASDGVTRCTQIAAAVAEKVQSLLSSAGGG